MRIKNLDGATTLGHDGETYEADEAGMFDVPHEVGESLVGFPHWVREHEYIDQAATARAAFDKDPQAVAGRLAALESVVPAMQVRIQALEVRIGELEAVESDAGSAEPELSRQQKAAATRAAKKAAEEAAAPDA